MAYFKVRLPKLIRLDEGDWKVALAGISGPRPQKYVTYLVKKGLGVIRYNVLLCLKIQHGE